MVSKENAAFNFLKRRFCFLEFCIIYMKKFDCPFNVIILPI